MRTGLENKRNVVTLAVLGLILLVSVGYFVDKMFLGGPPPTSTPATQSTTEQPGATQPETQSTAATTTHTESTNGHAAKKVVSLATLDPTLHPELMAGAESLVYAGNGRNIFSMSSVPEKIEQVAGPVRNNPVMNVAKGPQGPAPPPAIDLTFFGYESGGGAKKAFLLHGEDVFIASEGDVVDHHYKVVKINPLSIQVTDLLYNNTQTLPLSQS
jgi:hypothetical protein